AVQPRIQRVEQNESLLREQPREQFSEGTSIRLFGAVTLFYEICQQVAAFVAQQPRSRLRHLLHLRSQPNLPHRLPSLRHVRQLKPFELASMEPYRMADLFKVMIFRRHPEDWHRSHARLRQLL